jgi:UDP-N-acetylmuramoylalanine--D-glutamate ligase
MIPTGWHSDWSKSKVAVFGLGKSGFSVADTLVELGSKVTVFAAKAEPALADLLEVIGAELVPSDQAGNFDPAEFDFVVVSPGFTPEHPMVLKAKSGSLPVITDIDLAWRLRDKTDRVAKWITITGTNGKTTTTELCAHMISTSGQRAVACGNIGNPILDAIRDPQGFDYLVVELSSFQLHYLDEIHPVASAFLNLAEDHLDWHGSMDKYSSAKAKVFQNTELALVYNVHDPVSLKAAEDAEVVEGCRAIGFTLATPAVSMVGYVEDILVDRAFLDDRANSALEIATLEDIEGVGPKSKHLLLNLAAATALCRAVGVPPNAIKAAIQTFSLSPHRIQLVASIAEVAYVDDSKATNAHAADASLSSFEKVVWIVGGLLKGVDPKPLIVEHAQRLRAAVIIGADTQLLQELFSELTPQLPVKVISGEGIMHQAVLAAKEFAQPGDTVLLAPAAASMDQFLDYADRGEQFQNTVRELMQQ